MLHSNRWNGTQTSFQNSVIASGTCSSILELLEHALYIYDITVLIQQYAPSFNITVNAEECVLPLSICVTRIDFFACRCVGGLGPSMKTILYYLLE